MVGADNGPEPGLLVVETSYSHPLAGYLKRDDSDGGRMGEGLITGGGFDTPWSQVERSVGACWPCSAELGGRRLITPANM